jgi:hypothetical protein
VSRTILIARGFKPAWVKQDAKYIG